jgi:hypothetical protein
MGQVIGTNSWVLTGDDDPQDWNVAVARRALCKELVDCGGCQQRQSPRLIC